MLFICLLLAAPAAAEPALSLDQAIALALAHNRQIQASSLDVRNARNERENQKTQALPATSIKVLGSELISNVDFVVPAGSLGTFTQTGPIPARNTVFQIPQGFNTYLTADVQQPITQLPRIHWAVEAQDAAVLIAMENVRLQRQTVTANVRKAYYGVLQYLHAERVGAAGLKALQELERTVSDYVARGTALDADLQDVRARLARQEHDLLSVHNSLLTTEEQLNLLLGRDLDTPLEPEEIADPAESPLDVAQLLRRALEQRPEMRQAALKLRQASLDARIHEAQFGPDLGLALTYLRPYQGGLAADQFLTFGVQMTWTPVDWGSKEQILEEKRRNIEKARVNLRETEEQVRLNVRDAARRLDEARDLARVSKVQVAAATERSRVALNRYHVSLALLKDVLDAQAGLQDANRQYQDAVISVASSVASLRQSLGEDD